MPDCPLLLPPYHRIRGKTHLHVDIFFPPNQKESGHFILLMDRREGKEGKENGGEEGVNGPQQRGSQTRALEVNCKEQKDSHLVFISVCGLLKKGYEEYLTVLALCYVSQC